MIDKQIQATIGKELAGTLKDNCTVVIEQLGRSLNTKRSMVVVNGGLKLKEVVEELREKSFPKHGRSLTVHGWQKAVR